MTDLTDALTARYGPPEEWPEKVRLYVHWSERQNSPFLSHAEEHADAALLELLRENERLTFRLEFGDGLFRMMRLASVEMQNADLKRDLERLEEDHAAHPADWKGKCGGLQDVIDLLRSSGVDESANADKWEWVARHRLTGRELPDTIVRERDACTIGELLRRYAARAPHPSRSEDGGA